MCIRARFRYVDCLCQVRIWTPKVSKILKTAQRPLFHILFGLQVLVEALRALVGGGPEVKDVSLAENATHQDTPCTPLNSRTCPCLGFIEGRWRV